MKKGFALLLTAALMITGCGSSFASTNTPAPADTAKETEKETEKETKEAKFSGEDSLIKVGNFGDGFITYDSDEVGEALANMNYEVKELTADTLMSDSKSGENKVSMYKFTMINVDSLQEYPSGGGAVYATSLVMDDGEYLIMFGSSEDATYEEVLPYCSAGKMVEYWALGSVKDGVMLLVPFVAGTENSGYYLVKPCAKAMGAYVDEMTIPEAVGDDFDTSDLTGEVQTEKETEKETKQSANAVEGSVVLNIVNVENGDVITVADCTIQNKFDFDIAMSGEKFYVNGVDYSKGFTSYFEVKKGETAEDELFIDDCQLKRGDELEIHYTLMNAKTYETVGELRFVMVLE